MIDVAFLITSLNRGGAETQLVRVALSLRRRGWKVGILTMLPSSAYLEEVREAGIELAECVTPLGRLPWRMVPRVVRTLRRWQPPVLVTFNFPADVMGRICGPLAGVPILIGSILTAHVKSIFREWFYRYTEPLVALTVSNSSAALRFMDSRRILSPGKTMVIPNGVAVAEYPAVVSREAVRAELDLPMDAFLWIAVGNLREAKDYPTLVRAAERCAKADPRFRLLVVGGGDLLEGLREEAASRGLGGIVRFLGSRGDVARFLSISDAYVLSSAWEGMPNTVMEAMASALPVVATQVGGVAELVEDGSSGFLVPPGDPAAMADRMIGLMALEPEHRRRMGTSGRDRMAREFDMEVVVDRWVALFQSRMKR
jgi:glycosyltransferase involved in cell wall biosynthesis